jgi:hypothetical protein
MQIKQAVIGIGIVVYDQILSRLIIVRKQSELTQTVASRRARGSQSTLLSPPRRHHTDGGGKKKLAAPVSACWRSFV